MIAPSRTWVWIESPTTRAERGRAARRCGRRRRPRSRRRARRRVAVRVRPRRPRRAPPRASRSSRADHEHAALPIRRVRATGRGEVAEREGERVGGVGGLRHAREAQAGARPSLAPGLCRAAPYPATASFTSFEVYSTTGQPCSAATSSATPLAWPTHIAVRAFVWKKTRSTTTTSGRSLDRRARRARRRSSARRSGTGRSAVGRDHPGGDGPLARRARSTTAPKPQRDRPGSIPRTNMRSMVSGRRLSGECRIECFGIGNREPWRRSIAIGERLASPGPIGRAGAAQISEPSQERPSG